jgi:PAS domain S-box-containing protein
MLGVVSVLAALLNTITAGRHELLACSSWTAAAGLAVLGTASALRRASPDRARAWRYLLFATISWAVGQLAWDAYAAWGVQPSPNLADAGWLMFPVLAAIGTYRLLPRSANTRTLAVARLETAPLMVAVGALVWAALHDTAMGSALSLPAAVTATAYPILYLSLPVVMVQAFAGGPARARANRDLLLVLGGLALEAVAFSLWAPELLAGSYEAGHSAIDSLWTAGMLAIGLGGLWHHGATTAEEHEPRLGGLLPSLMFIVLLFIVMWAAATGEPLHVRLVLQIGLLGLALALIFRSVLLTREQKRLLAAQRAAHEELRQARMTSQRFFGLSRDLLFSARDGWFLDVNPAWEQTLGWTREQLLSRPFVEFLHPDDRERTAAHAASLTGREAADSFHNRCLTTGGEARWLSWSSRLEDGVIYARGADITDRRRVEEERQKDARRLAAAHAELGDKATELRRSNDELEQFAYAASHDLAEPLRSISGFSQFLLADYADALDEDGREYLGYITDGSQRMRSLIDGLLEYSRVGRERPVFEVVSVDDLLDDVLQALHAAVGDTGARTTRGPLPAVRGDRRELARVLQNLLSNAIKFTRAGESPAIHVDAQPHPDGWCFSVADEGIGVDPQFSERIFGMFRRLHQREEYPGTGIGLTISKRIVERHGGAIWMEERPGGGSIFKFTLRSPQEVATSTSTE